MPTIRFDRLAPSFDSTSPADWRARLPTALELLLVLLLAAQAARLLWLMLIPNGPIGSSMHDIGHVGTITPLPAIDVFFRRVTTASSPSGSSEALGYTLFGVRRQSGDGGSAILGKDGEQMSYTLGSEIAPGIVLVAVGVEHAVLAADNVRYRLELPMRSGGATTNVATSLPVGATKMKSASATSTAPSANTAVASLKSLSRSGLFARTEDGHVITPNADNAMFRQAGLQAGDLLLSVNGQPFDPDRLAGLQAELKDRRQLKIRYRRDGKVHSTTVQAPR